MTITLTVNGTRRPLTCEPHESLRTVLRRAGLHSVRFGSGTGETGAAAVLLDGRLISADVMLAAQADGHDIETIEGLSVPGHLHPIQQAFIETGAIQSGYSTPATILSAKALLDRNPNPTEDDVRDALSGILDRETGYLRPVHAVLRAAAVMRGEEPDNIDVAYLPPLLGDGGSPSDREDLSEIAPRVVPSADVPETRVVGKPEAKVDAIKLVKGNPAFTDDVDLTGTLIAKVLYSPHAHARIVSIDDSKARALPGVHAVLHHGNVPRVRYASGGQSYPNPLPYDQVSFDNKVRYVGDRVAAVAADTEEIALAAIDLIDVVYDVLPAVFDENEAILDGAPVIHDEPDMEGAEDASHNLVHHLKADTGNVDDGFAVADRVFEQTLRVHQVHATPIETHIAISAWDSDERLVITTSTQVPFHVRRMIAPLLDLPAKRIRIIKPRIGGGFGVKQEMLIEDIVAHLTIATGRPVRLELTREEEFVSSRTRHPQTVTFKTGVDAEGKLTAQEMSIVANTGPYGSHGLTVQMVTGLRGLSSYNCPVKKFDCRVAYTNIPVPGAYRGYGAPQALYALEAHMEDIAAELGMDSIEFRRLNWTDVGDPLDIAQQLGEGDQDADIMPLVTSSGLEEAVVQGQRAVDWDRRNDPAWKQPADKPNIRRGLGFAMAMHGTAIPGLDMGGASLKINDDGSFNLLVGATDLGTGSDTVVAQIAAEVVGVATDDIIVYSSDTDMTPFDTGAYASSTTYISGMATKRAAEQVRDQIIDRAALMLGVDAASIDLHDGAAWSADGQSVTLETIALSTLHQEGQHQIMANASYVSPESPPPYAAQFAEVEVDVETGQVTVNQLVMAVDCGVPINPVTASGQVEGGMVQALGYGHCEEMVYDEDGRMLNPTFGPYKIYRADEMPRLEAILVQTMEPSGPFGAKAIAEIPKDGVAPAIRNAIADATGARIANIPFTPERVWHALQEA
ncbi:MAG: molybdopterin cofactor-binding domain-containing protein [Actinomycetota bacterium]|nr:molybdopterin cofactor-binding domain-containing protein [Actinomycetota bacterium]